MADKDFVYGGSEGPSPSYNHDLGALRTRIEALEARVQALEEKLKIKSHYLQDISRTWK
jgi:hypothetical protein